MRGASWLLFALACAPSITPPPEEPSRVVVVIPPAPTSDAPVASHTPSLPPVVDERTTSPLEVPARDIRSFPPRSKPLLLVEIQGLESLSAATPPNAPDAPRLLRRIGDDYVELHRADQTIEAANRAIATYMKFIKSYGTNQPDSDQVMYALALEYELAKDAVSARKTYYELIVKQPNSKYIPYSYFGFGEMFFEEAKADPSKWDLAKQSYLEVLKYTSTLSPWALWRLGQVETARGNIGQAQIYEAKLRADYPQSDAVARIGAKP